MSLSLLPSPTSLPLVVIPDLLVTELTHAAPGTDVLIGLDVLLQGVFTLDVPARTFTLSY